MDTVDAARPLPARSHFTEHALEKRQGRRCIELLVTVGAKNAREVIGLQTTQDEIGVGNGQRPSLAVARGPWITACRLWADNQHSVVKKQPAAATRRDSVDV